jgi:hypothetical protein
MKADETKQIFGLGAEFPSAAALYVAAEKLRDKGFKWWDVYSPFPIHGMDKAVGAKKSWVSFVSLGGAATGLLTAVILQYGTSAFIYPLIVQGKDPLLSLPAYVPVMFELTILLCAFGTVFGMLLFNFLPRLHNPLFNWERFAKATDDGFFVVIESVDPLFSEKETPKLLEEIGGKNITFIEK